MGAVLKSLLLSTFFVYFFIEAEQVVTIFHNDDEVTGTRIPISTIGQQPSDLSDPGSTLVCKQSDSFPTLMWLIRGSGKNIFSAVSINVMEVRLSREGSSNSPRKFGEYFCSNGLSIATVEIYDDSSVEITDSPEPVSATSNPSILTPKTSNPTATSERGSEDNETISQTLLFARTIDSTTANTSSTTSSSQALINGLVIGAISLGVLILLATSVTIAVFSVLIVRKRKKRTFITDNESNEYMPYETANVMLQAMDTDSPHKDQQQHLKDTSAQLSAPVIESFPEPVYVVEGQKAHFNVVVTGTPTPTISWTFNQRPILSDYSRDIDETGSITFPSCQLSQTGTYSMTASNSSGQDKKLVMLAVLREEDEIIGGEGPQKGKDEAIIRPVPVQEFGDYVAQQHRNNNQSFISQFQSIPEGSDESCSASHQPSNITLNRFTNIIVYDHNRVVLQRMPGQTNCYNDYINASHVDGYSAPKKFIATQGPLPTTVQAFWQMIWQEKAPTIVMVTNLVERARDKCSQYWPDFGSMAVGPFSVTTTKQTKLPDYTIRSFFVEVQGDKSRGKHRVRQFHFTSWPDHGVPSYASPLLTFFYHVCKEHPQDKGPLVCHCSAGIGRTGTFIGINIILEKAMKEGVVDVMGTIKKMRNQRMFMVQSVDQFVFLHDAVLESLICGDTRITAGDLKRAMERLGKVIPETQTTGYDHEFKVLEQVSPNMNEALCSWAQKFPELNRSMDFLPTDRWRLNLKNESNSYLHATIVNGYKQDKAFFIVQTPMAACIRNLWKIIFDYQVSVVVQLTELREKGKEVCACYWPTSTQRRVKFGDYEVELVNESPCCNFNRRTISVVELKTHKTHQVAQFHVTWNGNGSSSSLIPIVEVIEEVSKQQRRTANHPIAVLCNDTVTRSAMFCSIYTAIERCKVEGMVDVFQVVKSLRIHRPGAILTVQQYRAIFQALQIYLETFDDYSNFL